MSPIFSVQYSTTPLANTYFTSGVSDLSTSGGVFFCVIGIAGNVKCVGGYRYAGVGLTTMSVTTPQEILFP